jgi:glucokinase
MTNLDWVITRAGLARATGGARAILLNDLQAQGHALDHLPPDHLTQVLAGRAAGAGATQLVIGVGTGFNAAPVHRGADGARMVVASESGHVGLPWGAGLLDGLGDFVARRHGFASVEDVLSGRGIGNVDAWLAERTGGAGTGRDAAAVMEALGRDEPRAVAAAHHFVRILGAVAGDLALVHLPYGGIYLAGGVARAFAPHLSRFDFSGAFCAKGRFSDFMRQFRVAVIEDDYAALIGCAAHLAAQPA